ncbi:mechanosensitive channel protein, partial [Klebsiella pneumoniae]|nr:mechanosensitive channel protein [Klebsiella pneumoniae]
TLWALYLMFHNNAFITEWLIHLSAHSLAFLSLFISAFALVWHWLACAFFVVLFFFSMFDPCNILNFMMGATLLSMAIICGAALVS